MKKLTTSEIIVKLKKVYGDEYSYYKVDYKGYNIKIELVCKEHGSFFQTPKKLLIGKRGCQKCNMGVLSVEKLKELFNNIHNFKFKYRFDSYKNDKDIIDIECPYHGFFRQSIKNHKKYGCKKCSKKFLDKEMFIEESKKIHGDIYDYSKVFYVNNWTSVEIKCQKHGYFKQRPNDHLMGHGCNICKQSRGEKYISDYLNKRVYLFETQKKFENCKNKRCLPFDFYLPKYNLCIEFDGKQHYNNIEKWGGDEALQDRMKNDKIKNNFCFENKIHLLRIRFDEDILEKLNNYFDGKIV